MRPFSARLRNHLLDLLVKQGLEDEALRVFEKIPVDATKRQPLTDAVRGACASARGEWARALGLLAERLRGRLRGPVLPALAGDHAAEQRATGGPRSRCCGSGNASSRPIRNSKPIWRSWLPKNFRPTSAGGVRLATQARRIRIDPAQPIVAGVTQAPIVTQATSADNR